VLRTDPESDVPPAVSGGLGDRYLPGSSTAARGSGTYETGPERPASTTYYVRFSDDLDVLGLKALISLDDLELDLLSFDECAISIHGDLGVMNEDIVSALSLDETEALLI